MTESGNTGRPTSRPTPTDATTAPVRTSSARAAPFASALRNTCSSSTAGAPTRRSTQSARPCILRGGAVRGAALWPAAARLEHSVRRGRKSGQLVGGASWARDELAAAIGTYALRLLCARDTERAFERADPRGGIGRKMGVAALAVRSELKHRLSSKRA